jgi:hypothetical protein
MTEHRGFRTAIAARLATVAGVGAVFEFERYAKDDKSFRTLYAAGGEIRGWHIRRVSRRESADLNEVKTTWELRGFFGLQDAAESELDVDDVIDAIGDVWRADPTLGGLFLYPAGDDPAVPELSDSGPAVFAGVLCHCVKLRLVTRHQIDAPRPWD